jgi:hypothetical protein
MPKATKTGQPAEIDPAQREREEQEIKARKEEATFHYKQIKQASVLQSRNSLRIGYHAFALKEKSLWGMLGFRDEQEAREAAGVKESTWHNVIRLAESFRGLPEELFTSMKLANCSELADLPEAKRLDREWVGWAADESMRVFSDRVAKEMNGKQRDSATKEPIITMKMSMPESRRTVIEDGAKKFAEKHGMDTSDVSRVIEVMVVEQSEGKTLIGAIIGAIQSLKRAKDVADSGLSVEEALEKVLEINDAIILEFSEVLSQAEQKNSIAA